MSVKFIQKIQVYWLADFPNHFQMSDGTMLPATVGVLYEDGVWWGLHNSTGHFATMQEMQIFQHLLLNNETGTYKLITWKRVPYPYANMTQKQIFKKITGVELS